MQFLNNVFHESMTGNKKPANHPGEEDFHQLHFCHINFPSHLHSENIWSKEIPSCKICGKNKAEHHFEKKLPYGRHFKDIIFLLFQFSRPLLISLNFTIHDLHTHGSNLVMDNNGMELGEAGETEEHIHNVGGKFCAFLPILPQHSRQGTQNRFYK